LQVVYDGRRCLGFLMSRGKAGVEAFDAADRSLGIFPDQKSAASAFGTPDAAGPHALADGRRRHG
jgi:hypothetical protein